MTGIFSGLQNLISGIQTVINGIVMAIKFLINLVLSIWELIKLLSATISNTTTLIATLPSWLIAVATATIGVSILYLIVGRETGK